MIAPARFGFGGRKAWSEGLQVHTLEKQHMRTYARKGTTAQRTTADESDATGAHSRQTLGLSSILHLQRTVGNQVVQRLIEEDATLVKDVSHKGIEDEDEPMRAEKIGAARDMLVIQGSGVLAAAIIFVMAFLR